MLSFDYALPPGEKPSSIPFARWAVLQYHRNGSGGISRGRPIKQIPGLGLARDLLDFISFRP